MKLSKKKDKLTKKFFKKQLVGGSNKSYHSVNLRASANKNINPVITNIMNLRDLIYGEIQIPIKIVFKNVILNCFIGNKKFIIGTNKDANCVKITYYPRNYCSLNSFFYLKNKQNCTTIINDVKDINNIEFKKNVSINGKIPDNYNKQFNELLMELFDIINLDININYCELNDSSQLKDTIKCGDIQMSILKHIERGYGFYNEFGYFYKLSKSVIKQKKINESIQESNDFLKKLEAFRNTLVSLDDKNIFTESIVIPDNIRICLSKIITENREITYKILIKTLMDNCKLQPDIQYIGIFTGYDCIVLTQIKEFLTNVIRNYFSKDFINIEYKFYNKDTNAVSRLVNKNNDAERKFEMVTMKKNNIELLKIEDDKYQYLINIV